MKRLLSFVRISVKLLECSRCAKNRIILSKTCSKFCSLLQNFLLLKLIKIVVSEIKEGYISVFRGVIFYKRATRVESVRVYIMTSRKGGHQKPLQTVQLVPRFLVIQRGHITYYYISTYFNHL